jgi:hypothetical protein
MSRRTKPKSLLFENVAFLAMIGILAGALGGFGVGLMTGRTASSSTPSTAK